MPKKSPRMRSLDAAEASAAAKLANGVITQEEHDQFVKLHAAARAFETEHAAVEKRHRAARRAEAQQLLAAASQRSERRLNHGNEGGGSFRGLLAGVANAVAKKLGARDSPSAHGGSFRSAGSGGGGSFRQQPRAGSSRSLRLSPSDSMLSGGGGAADDSSDGGSASGMGGSRQKPVESSAERT